MPLPRTYVATPKDIEKKWFVVDAEDLVLGRMASLIALRVRGKHKASYTPNMDCGDHVIVINAKKVKLTGNKRANKMYYWHTGYPGGIKERTAERRGSRYRESRNRNSFSEIRWASWHHLRSGSGQFWRR